MATRRPDFLMLAAMQLHGFLPEPVARGIIDLYDGPLPMSYESALEAVRTKVMEVIASGALEGTDAMPEPAQIAAGKPPNSVPDDGDGEHDQEFCPDCEFERRHPPFWLIDCFQFWDMITSDD